MKKSVCFAIIVATSFAIDHSNAMHYSHKKHSPTNSCSGAIFPNFPSRPPKKGHVSAASRRRQMQENILTGIAILKEKKHPKPLTILTTIAPKKPPLPRCLFCFDEITPDDDQWARPSIYYGQPTYHFHRQCLRITINLLNNVRRKRPSGEFYSPFKLNIPGVSRGIYAPICSLSPAATERRPRSVKSDLPFCASDNDLPEICRLHGDDESPRDHSHAGHKDPFGSQRSESESILNDLA